MYASACLRYYGLAVLMNVGFFKDGEVTMPKTLNNNRIGDKMFIRYPNPAVRTNTSPGA